MSEIAKTEDFLQFSMGVSLWINSNGQATKLPEFKVKFPSSGPAGIQLVESQHKLSFEAGDKIEVLCQDSGMRGCWFRCKILRVSEKHLKVQYDDILDCDGPEKLEEWIPSYRVANPDKLGTRCTGHLTVRPRPLEDTTTLYFDLGNVL
ncbi:hypothetical protein BC332_29352 [Capsicum chinense]|nr:hypothetical protein BC332_29352 [Capsicum chinense]